MSPHFVSNTTEDRELIIVAALRLRRIVITPMVTVDLAWEGGTGLVGVAADRNDRLDLLIEKFVQVL